MSVLNFCVAVVQNLQRHLSFFMGNEEGLNFYKESEQKLGNAEVNILFMFG